MLQRGQLRLSCFALCISAKNLLRSRRECKKCRKQSANTSLHGRRYDEVVGKPSAGRRRSERDWLALTREGNRRSPSTRFCSRSSPPNVLLLPYEGKSELVLPLRPKKKDSKGLAGPPSLSRKKAIALSFCTRLRLLFSWSSVDLILFSTFSPPRRSPFPALPTSISQPLTDRPAQAVPPVGLHDPRPPGEL